LVYLGKPGKMVWRIVGKDQTVDFAPAYGKSVEIDLKQRDFTVNAMAASVSGGKLIDIHSGLNDLRENPDGITPKY
jgi:tRNA nucleotidyltransferase/poly(A) polymerase